jgi:hypothetical protein
LLCLVFVFSRHPPCSPYHSTLRLAHHSVVSKHRLCSSNSSHSSVDLILVEGPNCYSIVQICFIGRVLTPSFHYISLEILRFWRSEQLIGWVARTFHFVTWGKLMHVLIYVFQSSNCCLTFLPWEEKGSLWD